MMAELALLAETKNRFSLINTPTAKMVDEINNSLMWGARQYLHTRGFVWIEVPTMTKITGACENVDTLYSLDHFGTEAYLAQTGQLYLEAKIPLHKKVWTIITSSRAEANADNRHLNQFQLIELEHQGDFRELLAHIEGTVKAMLKEVIINNTFILKELGRYEEVSQWASNPFGRITYTEGIKQLQLVGHSISWGDDLSTKEEQTLIALNGNRPLFITHFPKAIKFFNMRQNEQNADVVNSTDLIMPHSGESVGAAERENNYDQVVERLVGSKMYSILSQRGKSIEDFRDYLDLIRENPILHSGCGIGFNRISQSVLGSDDIRISSSFPIQSNILY